MCHDEAVRDAIVLLFWLWVLAALGYWAWRGFQAMSGKKKKKKEEGPLISSEEDLRTTAPIDLLTGEERPAETPEPPPAEPLDADAPTAAATPPPAAVAPGSSIFDPADAPANPSSVPIADLLSGIAMPCDLAPLLDATPRPGARETVTFSTTGHRAEEVGRSIGDELRRLEFEIEPITAMHVRATKEEGSLELEVHPEPLGVLRDNERVFPFAGDDSVVVEIWR